MRGIAVGIVLLAPSCRKDPPEDPQHQPASPPPIARWEPAGPVISGATWAICSSEPEAQLEVWHDGVLFASGPGAIEIDPAALSPGTWSCRPSAEGASEVTLLSEPARHNLMLVILDDVGLDKLESYGFAEDPPPTPNLSLLAAESLRFTNTWAMSECSPTRASLLTGRLPRRHGLGTLVYPHYEPHPLPQSEVTIAELLAPAGYDRSLVGKWHVASADDEHLLDPALQGFAWHAGTMDNLAVEWPPGQDGFLGYHRWQKNDNGKLYYSTTYATTDTVDDALLRISAMPEPWLLVVAFNAAHGPWDIPPQDLAPLPESILPVDRYASVLQAADAEFGRFMGSLPDDLFDRTTMIVVGDNGTPAQAIGPGRDAFRAKGTLYEGGIRVPLFVRSPLVSRPGDRIDTPVHVVDLLPTMAAIAGVALDDGVVRDGTSLLPMLTDPDYVLPRSVIYSERFEPNGPGPWTTDQRAVRDLEYKLAHIGGAEYLYHLDESALDEPQSLTAPFDSEATAALGRLRAALAAIEGQLGL